MDHMVNYIDEDYMQNPALDADAKPKTPDGDSNQSSDTDDNGGRNRTKKTGDPLTGPTSIYAIAEMNKRAELYTLKVRSELFRIGCHPSELSVLRQGIYLQMKYQQQIILVSPQEILGVLHKIPRGTELPEIWERICRHAHKVEKQKRRNRSWTAAVAVSLIVLAAFLTLYRL